MFTVCPKCSLKLVVTAADLRVAQGYVRCGRCSNVFNALIGLSDEQQAELARDAAGPEAGSGASHSTSSASATSERIEPYIDDGAQGSGDDAVASTESASDAALEFDPSQTDVSEVFVEMEVEESGSGSFESITLRTEEEPAAAAPPELRAPAPADAVPAASAVPATPAAPPAQAPSGARPERPRTDTPTTAPVSSSPDAEVHEFELPDPAAAQSAPTRTPARAAPKNVPAATAKDAPGVTAKAAPGAAPKIAPQRTLRPVPEPGPGVAAEPPQKRAPESAPKSAREPAPKAAPESAPKAAPESDAQGSATAQRAAWGSTQGSPGARLAAMKAIRSDASARVAILRRKEPLTHPAAPIAPAPAGPVVDDSVMGMIGDALHAAAPPEAHSDAAPLYERRLLRVAVAGLGVLLAAQVVHHFRAALAEVAWIRAPLTAIYATLGMPLVPRWDVAAYEVHQLGAIAGAGQSGGLTVRASIKNTAAKPQPLPLLRVTLQDRFGNHVAARDVPPRAYLPASSTAREYLAPGQRVDAEVQLVDPGAAAVGFEIDACLQDASGRVSCANDASGADVEP